MTRLLLFLILFPLWVTLSGCKQAGAFGTKGSLPAISDSLDKALGLQSVDRGAGVGGVRNDDSIASDHENQQWVIPAGRTNQNEVMTKAIDTAKLALKNNGCQVVSSNSGSSHGYKVEYLTEGGQLRSHNLVYLYEGGTGFVDLVQASYLSEEESGRILMNHIYLPNPRG